MNDLKNYELSALTSTTVKCSNIICYTMATGAIAYYSIYTLDGTLIYKSENYHKRKTWTFSLNNLNVPQGTIVILKGAAVAGGKSTNNVLLEYYESGPSVYYELFGDLIPTFKFVAKVESNSMPPVLQCLRLEAINAASVITRWDIIKDGVLIFESGKYSEGKSISIRLGDLDLNSGDRVKLKANVSSGADSTAYIILEYNPNVYTLAHFELVGTTFYTGTLISSIDYVIY